MKTTRKLKKNLKAKARRNETDARGVVEVLYQKMGDRWFAFSLVGDDVFMGSISSEEILRQESETCGENALTDNTPSEIQPKSEIGLS